MREYTADYGSVIVLGKRGENEAQLIRFDVSNWPLLYGEGGNYVLLAEHDGDEAPYMVPIAVEDGIITWTVTNSDTSAAGFGHCELQYYLGDCIAKSSMWRTRVYDALGEPGEAPEAYTAWVDEVLAAAQSVHEARDAVEAASAASVESAESASNSATRAEAALTGIQEAIEQVSESEGVILPLTESLFLEIVEEVLEE